MFTGIVETVAEVIDKKTSGTNVSFFLKTDITSELQVDQSISHNGVCLTVEEIDNGIYRVTAVKETLVKSNLSDTKQGDLINLERCMQMNARLDGHIVQGHVDTTAEVIKVSEEGGSWYYEFRIDQKWDNLIVEKGSICVNGVSLTVVNADNGNFSVAIIPYTFEHTNFHKLKVGDFVNIELDIIGKYILKYLASSGK